MLQTFHCKIAVSEITLRYLRTESTDPDSCRFLQAFLISFLKTFFVFLLFIFLHVVNLKKLANASFRAQVKAVLLFCVLVVTVT